MDGSKPLHGFKALACSVECAFFDQLARRCSIALQRLGSLRPEISPYETSAKIRGRNAIFPRMDNVLVACREMPTSVAGSDYTPQIPAQYQFEGRVGARLVDNASD